MLPFLQPYTVRDLVGYVGDIALNPVYWLMFPIIEIDAIPSLIPHKNRVTSSLILITARGTEIVNDRSLNLEKFEGVEESTLDLYAAVRNAYLQKRAKANPRIADESLPLFGVSCMTSLGMPREHTRASVSSGWRAFLVLG